jgi:hypothetical protein
MILQMRLKLIEDTESSNALALHRFSLSHARYPYCILVFRHTEY